MRIPMIATADFEWQGDAHAAGDRFDVPPVHAAALNYQRKARFVTSDDATPVAPQPEVVVQHTQALDATATKPVRKPRKPRKRRDIPHTHHTKA